MGKLNDKMTALAEAIRATQHGTYPWSMSIDEMIELVGKLHSWEQDFSGDASPEDVSIGKNFYSDSYTLQTGTMPDTAVSVDENTITIPAGRLREDEVITIPPGSVKIDGSTVTIIGGYLPAQTVAIPAGSVSVSGPNFIVSEGYIGSGTYTVKSGSVTIDNSRNKIIVSEGYVPAQEMDLPGGFKLVKVTNYQPEREEFTDIGSVVVSAGTVQGEYDSVDFSDIAGTYVVTPATQYKKGFDRVYKQQNGNYYLCGYKPEYEWEDSPQWYISDTIGKYGWQAKATCYNSDIPSGTYTWYSDMVGEFTMTTVPTQTTVPGLSESAAAVEITGFDAEEADWFTGGGVSVSDYSITPQTNGIYFLQGEKLIGQHIDRELDIPEDGLVRRWKFKDGHFIDTVWGTEMLPYGDISYDDLGYCKNAPAPRGSGKCYLETPNTLIFDKKKEYTFNVFFRVDCGESSGKCVFTIGTDGNFVALHAYPDNIFAAVNGWSDSRFIKGPAPIVGKWYMGTITITPDTSDDNYAIYKLYINGQYIDERRFDNYTDRTIIRLMTSHDLSNNFVGLVDDLCIWDRILTDEEIAEMAKGVKTFDWDIPVKKYVQEQPVFYAPLTENMDSMTGQAIIESVGVGTGYVLSYAPFANGGMCNYSTDGGNSGYHWGYFRTYYPGVYSSFFTSGDFAIMCELYPIATRLDWKDRDQIYNVFGSSDRGIRVRTFKGSQELYIDYFDSAGSSILCGESIPYNTWSTIIVVVKEGVVSIFIDAVLRASGTTSDTRPPLTMDSWVYTVDPAFNYRNLEEDQIQFKACQRNLRIYNRALSDEEIAELSGIEPEEE